MAADSRVVYSGGRLHDGLRSDLAAARIVDRARHGRRGGVGIPLWCADSQIGDVTGRCCTVCLPRAHAHIEWLTVTERPRERVPMFSRRDFGKMALAAVPLAAAGATKINSKIKGVQIGGQSYSFRDRPMAKAIEAFKEVGLGECELWQGHVEPQPTGQGAREELRKWRLETPLDDIRQRPQAVDRCRNRALRLQSQLQQQFHRRRDRPRLRDGQGDGRESDHRFVHRERGQEGGAVRRQAQNSGGHARPRQRQPIPNSSPSPRASRPRSKCRSIS